MRIFAAPFPPVAGGELSAAVPKSMDVEVSLS